MYRNEKCGGAEVPTSVGEPVLWNLGRCNTLGGRTHRGKRVIRCHCQGPGLFAVIKFPEVRKVSLYFFRVSVDRTMQTKV